MRIKKDNKLLVISIVILIFLVIAVLITRNNSKDSTDYSGMSEEEVQAVVNEEIEQMEKNDLGEMGERDRIEKYVADFLESIENSEYEVAYEMLNNDFKNNYFPTFSDFEQYAKNKFPSMIAVEHTNFERNGDVYIVWTNLSNPMGSKDSAIEMNFVVKENDLNDFELSFKVF